MREYSAAGESAAVCESPATWGAALSAQPRLLAVESCVLSAATISGQSPSWACQHVNRICCVEHQHVYSTATLGKEEGRWSLSGIAE